jgi:1,2-diacylglycerol 3-alpha-glucosyltransferase
LKILFVLGQLTLGGIETYCLRMCRALAARGHDLEVWVVKRKFDAGLLHSYREVVPVRFLTHLTPVPLLPIAPAAPADADLIFTTGRLALIFGTLSLKRQDEARLVTGVFSQWEFLGETEDYKSRISQDLLAQLGAPNIVFCTEGCRTWHEPVLGAEVKQSHVSPLLIELPEARPSRRTHRPAGDPIQIVSVGNFMPFKTYHFTLPFVLRDLRSAGVKVHWTVIGDGQEFDRTKRIIAEAGVEDLVTLAGRVPYDRFQDEVGKADLYIGAGTTLIEASALGVPSLVALDDNPDATTPGYFCDRRGIYTSDVAGDECLVPFSEAIAAFAAMPEDERADLRERSVRSAGVYSISRAEEEMAAIHAIAKPVRPRMSLPMKLLYIRGVLNEIVRVILRRGAYRVR